MQLAPAAGAGIGKLIADALLAMPDFIPLMRDAFVGGLQAQIHYYDRGAKEWCSRPDERTRLQAATLCLAHMEGEPIKRIIHQHLGASGEIDLLAAVRESPQLQDQLGALLEKAKFRDRKKARAVKAETEFE